MLYLKENPSTAVDSAGAAVGGNEASDLSITHHHLANRGLCKRGFVIGLPDDRAEAGHGR
jgi:hypothetical protein